MKIAVISDTHIPKRAKQLPDQLLRGIENVDLIIHAGDWQTFDVYRQLATIAPVEGVVGNVDNEELRSYFPKKKILHCAGISIGVVHGDGKGKTTEKRAIDTFATETISILIFGHSHIPILRQYKEITLFNPGSPTDKRRQPRYSYGMITIVDGKVDIRHHFFD